MIDFSLTDDQQAMVAMSRAFAARRIAPQALSRDAGRHFPTDVLAEAGALGLGAICLREEAGGSGPGRIDAALVFEALAAACPTIAAYVSIHNMRMWMIDRFGSAAQRRHWCPRLAPPDRRASYCLTEAGAGSGAAALSTRAVRDGADWVLTGQKQFISGVGSPDVYLVMARSGRPGAKGFSCFLVPGDAPGLSFGANERKMGWNAQPTRTVQLDDVRLGPEALLGAEGGGFGIAMAGLDGGRLNIAACSLGRAGAALAAARADVAGRHAFGGPLSQLQAVQFRLADMAVAHEAARSLLWRAAAALGAGAADATMLCAAAKRFVTDACFDIANGALQLLGGYGYLAAHGIEKIVRELRVHRILEGTNDIMRLIVARSLTAQP